MSMRTDSTKAELRDQLAAAERQIEELQQRLNDVGAVQLELAAVEAQNRSLLALTQEALHASGLLALRTIYPELTDRMLKAATS